MYFFSAVLHLTLHTVMKKTSGIEQPLRRKKATHERAVLMPCPAALILSSCMFQTTYRQSHCAYSLMYWSILTVLNIAGMLVPLFSRVFSICLTIQAFIETWQAPFKTQYPEIIRYVSANLQPQRVLHKAETSGNYKIQKSYSNIKYLASIACFWKKVLITYMVLWECETYKILWLL